MLWILIKIGIVVVHTVDAVKHNQSTLEQSINFEGTDVLKEGMKQDWTAYLTKSGNAIHKGIQNRLDNFKFSLILFLNLIYYF